MARYQIPPDPRNGESEASHAHRVVGRNARSSPPWLWIGLGTIVTVLAIAVAVLWARLFLDVKPAETEPTPPPVVNTATPTSPPPTPTGIIITTPNLDLIEVPTQAVEPVEESTPIPETGILIGANVTVVGTGVGLNLRAEPVVDPNNILELVQDGSVLEVIEGPQEAEDFVWWKLRSPSGTEGWAVEDFFQAP